MSSFLSRQIANHLNLVRVDGERGGMRVGIGFLRDHEVGNGQLADAIEIRVRPRKKYANPTLEGQAQQAGKKIGEGLQASLNSRAVIETLRKNGVPLTSGQQKHGLFDVSDEPSADIKGRPIQRVIIVPDHVGWAEQIYREYRRVAGPEIFQRRATEAVRRAYGRK